MFIPSVPMNNQSVEFAWMNSVKLFKNQFGNMKKEFDKQQDLLVSKNQALLDIMLFGDSTYRKLRDKIVELQERIKTYEKVLNGLNLTIGGVIQGNGLNEYEKYVLQKVQKNVSDLSTPRYRKSLKKKKFLNIDEMKNVYENVIKNFSQRDGEKIKGLKIEKFGQELEELLRKFAVKKKCCKDVSVQCNRITPPKKCNKRVQTFKKKSPRKMFYNNRKFMNYV